MSLIIFLSSALPAINTPTPRTCSIVGWQWLCERWAVARALEKARELMQSSRLQPAARGLGGASPLEEELQPALTDMDAPIELLSVLQQTLQTISGVSQVPQNHSNIKLATISSSLHLLPHSRIFALFLVRSYWLFLPSSHPHTHLCILQCIMQPFIMCFLYRAVFPPRSLVLLYVWAGHCIPLGPSTRAVSASYPSEQPLTCRK